MKIKTTYRGYEISYNENTERWICYDLENSHFDGSPSLSKIRERIDKMVADMRKAAAVEAIVIPDSAVSQLSKRNALVTEYLGKGKNRYSWEKDAKVAVMGIWGGNEKPSRKEIEISALIPNTKEALEAYEDALAAYREIEKAKAEYAKRFDAIPRLSLDDIKTLVEIYENQQSNPEQE